MDVKEGGIGIANWLADPRLMYPKICKINNDITFNHHFYVKAIEISVLRFFMHYILFTTSVHSKLEQLSHSMYYVHRVE